MSGRWVALVPVGILLALGVMTFWLANLVQSTDARTDPKLRHDPDAIIEHFTAQMLSPEGRVQYVLKAASMRHYPDDDSSELIDVTFIAQQPGKPDFRATAPRGQLLNGNDRIVLEGGVYVQSAAAPNRAATVLTTPRLTVLPQENLVRSTDGVVVTSNQGTIRAAKFEMHSKTREVTFHRGTATLNRAAEPERSR